MTPVTDDAARAPRVPEDLHAIIRLALDLGYYRSVDDDGGLGAAAWLALRDAVNRLPEASSGKA